MPVNHSVGVLEDQETVSSVMKNLVRIVASGRKLRATMVPCSEHHNGKPMIVVSEEPYVLPSYPLGGGEPTMEEDVTIWHIEISEEGVFAYSFDDGAS